MEVRCSSTNTHPSRIVCKNDVFWMDRWCGGSTLMCFDFSVCLHPLQTNIEPEKWVLGIDSMGRWDGNTYHLSRKRKSTRIPKQT